MCCNYRTRAFFGWCERIDEKKYYRKLANKAIRRIKHLEQAAALQKWMDNINDAKADREQEEKQSMSQRLQELEQEKARLERDNERFVRLIDSGEWGKGRVEEIVKAGEAMRKEREEVQGLLNQLREDYNTLQKRRENQDEEINGLKERLLSGNFMQRNKMLVRGASQYNASSKAATKPSLETVSAFADGDFHPKPDATTAKNRRAQASSRSRVRGQQRQPQDPALTEAEVERLQQRYANTRGGSVVK